MALDAGWLLDEARSALGSAASPNRVVVSLPERAVDEPRRNSASLFKRAARLAVRIHCALQLRWGRIVYRSTLREVGPGCVFGAGLIVQGHQGISLGRDVRVNDYVFLQCGGDSELIIGDEVTISIGARVMTGQYPVGAQGHDRSTHVYETVVIEDGAWIGANAVILPGVRIGAGSIVAAGAVVNRDVPPGVIVAGKPAQVIRRHDEFEDQSTGQLAYLRSVGVA